ncbi:MAG: F0F1 ATP synthase subunit A [Bradymonadales bacterium]|nr:F0F1 ATP synthase subunit A [Bradymonadales bacterium]
MTTRAARAEKRPSFSFLLKVAPAALATLLTGCSNASQYEHFTWLNRIPGFNRLDHHLGVTFWGSSVRHVVLSLIMTAIVVLLAQRAFRNLRDAQQALVPSDKPNAANFFEIILDAAYGTLKDAAGEKYARRCLPLVGTVTIYVFFSNILGLIPGLSPPTDNLNATIAPAIVVFFGTHYYGVKEHGAFKYAKHFLGPVWYIAPLYLAIEIVSHLFRVVSLSFRLMGNMIGDHKVISAFLGLTLFSYIFPVPMYIMGLIVCTMQTLVFTLLTIVYIQLAVAHQEQ